MVERDAEHIQHKAEHRPQIKPTERRSDAAITDRIEQPTLHSVPEMREEAAHEPADSTQDGLQGAANEPYRGRQHRIPRAACFFEKLLNKVDGNAQGANNDSERCAYGAPQIEVAEDLPHQKHD